MSYIHHLCILVACSFLAAQAPAQNNILRGRVLYQSSGNKPAPGVHVREQDSNGDYSKDDGAYRLVFQSKRDGAALSIDISPDTRDGKKIELVNEKELKAAILPANPEETLEIIVCPAGQRDLAAQRYYRILRTAADRELERTKQEVATLLEQKDKDYQKISDLFAQLDRMQAALDSAKIRVRAFDIASINLDRASALVREAVQKIDLENDVDGALRILNTEALDTAYTHASALKQKAEAAIRQVIEGYEFKISLLEPQFKYGEVAECYEKIAEIYEREGYDRERLAEYITQAANYWKDYGDYQKQLTLHQNALAIREKILSADHFDLGRSYHNLASAFGNLGDYQKQLEFNLKALAVFEKTIPPDHPYLAKSYGNIGDTYGNRGEFQKQFEFNFKALAIWEKILPADDPDLASGYGNLAVAYSNLHQYHKALEFDQKALSIREIILSADHPDLALSYNNIGSTYLSLNEPQKSLIFHRKALVIVEKVFPVNHPHRALAYNNLAVAYGRFGEFQNEVKFMLQSLSIVEKVLPPDHPNLAILFYNIANTYQKVNDYQNAIKYAQRSIQIGETMTPKHFGLNRFYISLATTYMKIRRYAEAKTALEKSESLNAEKHIFQAWAMYHGLQNNPIQTLENLQKAVDLGFNDLHWITTDSSLTCIRDWAAYRVLVERLERQKLSSGQIDSAAFYFNTGYSFAEAHQFPQAKTYFEKFQTLDATALNYRNWAVYFGFQNDGIRTIENLQKAVDLGFNDLDWITAEKSLGCIRDWAAYKALVQRVQKKQPETMH